MGERERERGKHSMSLEKEGKRKEIWQRKENVRM